MPSILLVATQLAVLSSATALPIVVAVDADPTIRAYDTGFPNLENMQKLTVTFNEPADANIIVDIFNYIITKPGDSSFETMPVYGSFSDDPKDWSSITYSSKVNLWISSWLPLLEFDTTYLLHFMPSEYPAPDPFELRTRSAGPNPVVPDAGGTLWLLTASILGLTSIGRRWRK